MRQRRASGIAPILVACVVALSGCAAASTSSPATTSVATTLEGLPVPAGASLTVSGARDGGSSQEWDTGPDVTLASVDDWYTVTLPIGRSWHDWQACHLPPPTGTINTTSPGTQRTWSKGGKLLTLLTGSSRNGGGVRVMVAVFTPPPSPVGLGPC